MNSRSTYTTSETAVKLKVILQVLVTFACIQARTSCNTVTGWLSSKYALAREYFKLTGKRCRRDTQLRRGLSELESIGAIKVFRHRMGLVIKIVQTCVESDALQAAYEQGTLADCKYYSDWRNSLVLNGELGENVTAKTFKNPGGDFTEPPHLKRRHCETR